MQQPVHERLHLPAVVHQLSVGQLSVIEIDMEPLSDFEVLHRNLIAGISTQPQYRLFQMRMFVVTASLPLSDGNNAMRRCSPQLFRALQFIPGRKLPVGFLQKKPGRRYVFLRFDGLTSLGQDSRCSTRMTNRRTSGRA